MKSWLEKLLIVLLLDYLFLFGLETILPGFVMAVFNLNYFLLFILALWAGLIVANSRISKAQIIASQPASNATGWRWLILGTVAFATLVAVFSLYKADAWQIALYIPLALISGALTYQALKK